jgi:hypothetical protein
MYFPPITGNCKNHFRCVTNISVDLWWYVTQIWPLLAPSIYIVDVLHTALFAVIGYPGNNKLYELTRNFKK